MTTRKRKVKAEPANAFAWEYSAVPEWKLPRTAEAYDAMVEQMAEAIHIDEGWVISWSGECSAYRDALRDSVCAALRSIGVTRPQEAKP